MMGSEEILAVAESFDVHDVIADGDMEKFTRNPQFPSVLTSAAREP
jgi:hypothetical protein